ncbi:MULTISPECIES: sugar ABC transporter permease [unclassified Chelatococcus]|uniref:carbohydrate ABC transporter permease n=1 Tax=unclassified Chelatococcus TaxID=2638111 RepID=UPI0020BED87A|nr:MULTISPECIES: sugar ABC transporter permease [unclassified Chelatococcus]MCO5075176.1 sugar ABC transporter permease [Chelatococcus sp.]CAH1657692.1 Sugar ABC transporter permease [Hyphomicrobiales bacterium]CAH1689277.1 Sugar ABC transporter permease [Hyphomicrobiales bacterium]
MNDVGSVDRYGRSARFAGALMLAPMQLQLIVVLAIPSLYVLWLSFTQSSYGADYSFVGWANYAAILADPIFWRSLINTLIVVNIVVYVEVGLSVGVALLFQGVRSGRAVLMAAILAPYAISEVVAVLAWRFLLEPDIGMLTALLSHFGYVLNWATNPNEALILVALIGVWLHLPFSFLLIYAALIAIPGELHEAAHIDGARPWQGFRYVTLPLLMPAIMIAIIFRYIFGFRIFTEVWLLTQGGPARSTEVMAVYLYKNAFRYNEFGMAAATGWLMVLGALLMASFYVYHIYRSGFRNEA